MDEEDFDTRWCGGFGVCLHGSDRRRRPTAVPEGVSWQIQECQGCHKGQVQHVSPQEEDRREGQATQRLRRGSGEEPSGQELQSCGQDCRGFDQDREGQGCQGQEGNLRRSSEGWQIAGDSREEVVFVFAARTIV